MVDVVADNARAQRFDRRALIVLCVLITLLALLLVFT